VEAYQRGKRVDQCFWAIDNKHLVFRDQERVFLLELLSQSKSRIEPFVTIREASNVFYDAVRGYLYFLECSQGYLSRIKLFTKEPDR